MVKFSVLKHLNIIQFYVRHFKWQSITLMFVYFSGETQPLAGSPDDFDGPLESDKDSLEEYADAG